MDLTFFKDSFSNIRLEIHLVLSQWDHTDPITNISFHYCICRFKWHIYMLSARQLDKQLQQTGLECRAAADLPVDVSSQPRRQGPAALTPLYSCCLPSVFYLTAKNADSSANSLNSDFLSDQKMTNEVLTPVDEHVTKMT